MTLVLLYANDEYAYVAADRRLTYPNLSVAENDRTKLMTCYQGLVFGFTGQAFIRRGRERVSAPMWLAHAISEQEGTGRIDFNLIADQLTRTRLAPGDKRLAFGAIGFFNTVTPTTVLVSNMHEASGAQLLHASDSFSARVEQFEGEAFLTLGGSLSPKAAEMLRERMPVASANPQAVRQLLAGAIEASTSRTIGKQSLVTTMRRNAPPGEDAILCDTVIPGLRGPRYISDAAMPVGVMVGGGIMAVQHRHRKWPDP